MSSLIITVVIIGAVGYALAHRCELLGLCGSGSGSTTIPPTVPATATAPKTTITGDKYAITNASAGPANCGSSDHEADLGFGFSKDGGPVAADGYTSDEGEPRVGDNRNNKSMTIAQLPGPCETKPYKGKVQYRYRNLSASCDSCQQAKQYYLYKYGIGGVNPIPGTNGGEGIREGGAKGPGVKTIVPDKKVKGAKASFARVAYW